MPVWSQEKLQKNLSNSSPRVTVYDKGKSHFENQMVCAGEDFFAAKVEAKTAFISCAPTQIRTR